MPKRSLFIVSLPRSLSMFVYRVARDATGLAGPSWAVGGEILNHDLLLTSRWPKLFPGSRTYVTPQTAPERIAVLHEYLDDATHADGRIYKDVVQPFVLASWPGLSRFNVLKIRRNLVEVAHSVLRMGWHYPKDALPPDDSLRSTLGMRIAEHYAWTNLLRRALRIETHGRLSVALCTDAVIKGLILAERALEQIPGTCVDYDDLVRDEVALRSTLGSFYPESDFTGLRYVDTAFVERRRKTAETLTPKRRRALEARIERLRAERPSTRSV